MWLVPVKSGMRKIYRVKLFGEERAYLEELVHVGKAAARTLTHARVLLKADEGPDGPAWGDDQIVDALEVSRSTVEPAFESIYFARRWECRLPGLVGGRRTRLLQGR